MQVQEGDRHLFSSPGTITKSGLSDTCLVREIKNHFWSGCYVVHPGLEGYSLYMKPDIEERQNSGL